MKSFARTKTLLAYFVVPAAFCCLGYLLLFLALQPVWGLASAAAGTLIAQDAPNFDSNLSVIYDPSQEKPVSEGFIDGSSLHYPDAGEQYAQISCAEIGLDAPVYWYDSDEILAYGVGSSLESLPAGYGSGVVISGHNTTDFRCLEYIQPGQVVHFDTNYCHYEYTVREVRVMNEKELSPLISEICAREDKEELVMYTCYPFYAISGRKTERLVVFADRTAGIDVKWRETA